MTQEPQLPGHWSNGDPVHLITDGVERWVAPNHNGAEWVMDRMCAATWDDFKHHRCEKPAEHDGDHVCWACEDRRQRIIQPNHTNGDRA